MLRSDDNEVNKNTLVERRREKGREKFIIFQFTMKFFLKVLFFYEGIDVTPNNIKKTKKTSPTKRLVQ